MKNRLKAVVETARAPQVTVKPQDLQDALDSIDWKDYWKQVIQKTSEEVSQYERARAKSREVAAYHVML